MSNVLDLDVDLVTRCHFFPVEHNVQEYEKGHTTPSEALVLGYLTQAQYDEYDHYTIVRDPTERFVSAYGYRTGLDEFQTTTPEEFFEANKLDLVMRKQVDYLVQGGVTTYPFSDYENSIRTIVSALGGTLHDVPHIEHKTKPKWRGEARTAIKIRDLAGPLEAYYAADYDLDY
jgi:hypothetical protein